MNEPTEQPEPGRVRIVVQLSCGCDSYLDLPVAIFERIRQEFIDTGAKGVTLADAQRYVFGRYMVELCQQLEIEPHYHEGFCPRTFGSEINGG